MYKYILLAASLCFLAFQATAPVTAQGNCETRPTPPVCQGGGRITINNQSKRVSPPNLCASPGETIEVNVVPDGTTASIAGKDGGWPSGGPDSSFTITAEGNGEYNYNVYFEDGSCLDPRISVGD